jgi:uncharacterized protein (DUF924 family)
MTVRPEDVLTFWFGDTFPVPSERISFWFKKSDETDAQIAEKFGDAVRAALAGGLDSWSDTPRGRLALVLLLDQFTRNIFRDTPRAFAGDPVACAHTLEAIAKGEDRELEPDEAFFLYMPLEHQEDIHLQEQCVEIMRQLASSAGSEDESKKFDGFVDYAIAHRDVIAEYGRFPHRNSILKRPSTAAEEEYLSKPGAGF